MSRRPLLEYEIEGDGHHCTVDIFVNKELVITLDTGTKYVKSVEESLAKLMKKVFINALKDGDNDYLSVIEPNYDEDGLVKGD